MPRHVRSTARWSALLTVAGLVATSPALADVVVTPTAVTLDGPEATQQLLVRDAAGLDLTRQAKYESAAPNVVRVDATGLVEVVGEGKTEIRVEHGGQRSSVTIEVKGVKAPVPVSFSEQVVPLLTKAGCNSGGCHGKAEGQNGFRLSVFGFDAAADFRAIAEEGRGRRLLPSAPASSLLVTKATGRVPHGGGRKIADGSFAHKRLVRWIAEGAARQVDGERPVVAVEVEPKGQTLALNGSQQLRVTAIDDRGTERCVTAEAEFETNAPAIAGVDGRGHVQAGMTPGEAAILVRYSGHVTVARFTVPNPGVTFARPPEVNFIDTHVWDKLARLGIPPSDLAADGTFLRRAYLDTIGTLPSAAEARKFLDDGDPKKRATVIDALLDRPEYADYWAMRWADLLRVDRDLLAAPGAVAMTRWLRGQFAENRPYDQFVRDIVTAEGAVTREGPAGFFKAFKTPDEMSRAVSQLFLGVRIECAQCHHHPSEKWGQDDYYALAGFFTGVGRKAGPSGDAIIGGVGTDMKHPRTGQVMAAKALGASPAVLPPDGDRRRALADWMTTKDNPFLARSVANRLWAHYLGRGLVEPLDDLRATNPASNEPLLDALTAHVRERKYDLKAVTRTILNSRAYQLGSATAANIRDEQNFSHVRPRPMPAEVLLDALSQTTGVPEKFAGWPVGVRAIQVWDNRVPSYFLTLFGKPARTSVCECERSGEPSIAQALHLMNAPEIDAKIRARKGTARNLADSKSPPAAVVEELYLGVLARRPTATESKVLLALFEEAGDDRRAAVEDALWTLLNTKEFVFNH
jgi:hypothetical protein